MKGPLAFLILALFSACGLSEAFAPNRAPHVVVGPSSTPSAHGRPVRSAGRGYSLIDGAGGRGRSSSAPASASSTTALGLKIKVDPDKAGKNKGINPGLAKGAAYGGSIVIAVLLPIIFLAWAALKH